MDEFFVIRKHFAPLASALPGAFSLRDDAALIDVPPGKQLVITKDAISEGVHFIGNESPDLIARKLLRTNLSDLAAKGARPYCYFLSAAFKRGLGDAFIAKFAEGLKADQEEFGVHLAGGDTITTQHASQFSLTALGLVPYGQMLKRSGAKSGDLVFCSGTLGDGALGLLAAQGKLESEFLSNRYHLPQPRLTLGKALRGLATASMDISDGLVQDASHMATSSNVGIELRADTLPLSAAAKLALAAQPELFTLVMTGGDDYELLFTAPEEKRGDIIFAAKNAGTPITEIGRVVEGAGVHVLDEMGADITPSRTGYSHF